MTMDCRRFLKTSAVGLGAAAWWLRVPTLARADGGEGSSRFPSAP